MADFTRLDTYNPQSGFQRVHWGAQSKVLEVELTEMQKVLAAIVDNLGKTLFSDGFLVRPALTYSAGTLTVPADTLFLGGRRLDFQDPMTIAVGASSTVWVAISEGEIMYNNTVRRNGNMSGGATVPNNIYDNTIALETSRRVQLQLQLVTSNADTTKSYLPVASISSASALTDNRVQSAVTLPADPTSPFHAGTKQYIDAQVALARTYAP